jgi:predicted enzyme related to lactoylglutathione lyase
MATTHAGRFTWHELMTNDPAAAAKFYAALFGWTVQETTSPAGTYHMFMKGDQGVGGAMTTPPGVHSHWFPYVYSDDPDATARKLTELGGKVIVPPTDVPNMVRFAVADDAQGAALGIMKNIGPERPARDEGGPPTPGTFCWDELYTKDLDAAATFYKGVFGWTGHWGQGEPKYWHWQNAGKEIGGMMNLMMPNVPPHWASYVAVADVDASTNKVKELGGKVLKAPMTIERVGTFSFVADPTGAYFAMFRSARV